MESTVAHKSVQADGTIVTHLTVPGEPAGELILQENEAAGFFLGQLYYENHPVAYEFKETNRGLTATRHPIGDLICSIVGLEDSVTIGLPTAEDIEFGKGKKDDKLPAISIKDAKVEEGTGETEVLTFEIKLDKEDKKSAITVDFATSDGTAVSGDDYTALSGTIVIPKDEKKVKISIPIVGDVLVEEDETFTLSLSNPFGATIKSGSATGTIRDDDEEGQDEKDDDSDKPVDELPVITIKDAKVEEGTGEIEVLTFELKLDEENKKNAITVDFTATDGTAEFPSDYFGMSGTIVIPKKEKKVKFFIPIIGDAVVEDDETLIVTLSNPSGATIEDGTATGTIRDDDKKKKKEKDLRALTIKDASVDEGTDGSTVLTFEVKVDKEDKKNAIMVDYATSDGTAVSPDDYTAMSGTLMIPKKKKKATISIPIVSDSLVEGDESFTVTLSNPSGAVIEVGSATGTIFDDDIDSPDGNDGLGDDGGSGGDDGGSGGDDGGSGGDDGGSGGDDPDPSPNPLLSTFDLEVAEGDSGSTTVSFIVELDIAAAGDVTVDFETADGTATANSDYLPTSGTLTFSPGETTKTVEVDILGDTEFEPAETFFLLLSNPVGAGIDVGDAICLIVNDDPDLSGVPALNSLPGATAVAFLDLDGHTAVGTPWNQGGPIDVQGVTGIFAQSEMTEIWDRVAEDFAPFQINVTTDENVYLAALPGQRVRCVVTPDSSTLVLGSQSIGGVAFVGSFRWPGDTPCWVFSGALGNSTRLVAEACSHEIGHTLGLNHDGQNDPFNAYYRGHGNGPTGWAPIMGIGFNKELVQWSKGEYVRANNTGDDLLLIAGGVNGFGFRDDDHADTSGTATALDQAGTSVSGEGLIESENDTGVFSFTVTTSGLVDLLVESPSASPNLDILAEIRDANGTILATDNDPELLEANPVVVLDPGTYYLFVRGTGKGNPLGTGYTAYGSIGQYTISGQTP